MIKVLDKFGFNVYTGRARTFKGAIRSIIRYGLLSDLNLKGKNLSGINFHGAGFGNSDLTNANLSNCKLEGCDLFGTKVEGTNFTGTCYDPKAKLPDITDYDLRYAGFEKFDDTYVYGYRTRRSYFGNTEYKVRKTPYVARPFSHDKTEECSSGIYLGSKRWILDNYPGRPHVYVKCKRSELVCVGGKWRCKRLWVLEDLGYTLK